MCRENNMTHKFHENNTAVMRITRVSVYQLVTMVCGKKDLAVRMFVITWQTAGKILSYVDVKSASES